MVGKSRQLGVFHSFIHHPSHSFIIPLHLHVSKLWSPEALYNECPAFTHSCTYPYTHTFTHSHTHIHSPIHTHSDTTLHSPHNPFLRPPIHTPLSCTLSFTNSYTDGGHQLCSLPFTHSHVHIRPHSVELTSAEEFLQNEVSDGGGVASGLWKGVREESDQEPPS